MATEARPGPSLRSESDYLSRFARLFALRRAVGCDQARLPNHGLGTRDVQAGSFEMRPGLLRAIAACRADVQPIALGKRLRHAGFDLWSKSGQHGQGGGDKRSNSDG